MLVLSHSTPRTGVWQDSLSLETGCYHCNNLTTVPPCFSSEFPSRKTRNKMLAKDILMTCMSDTFQLYRVFTSTAAVQYDDPGNNVCGVEWKTLVLTKQTIWWQLWYISLHLPPSIYCNKMKQLLYFYHMHMPFSSLFHWTLETRRHFCNYPCN